MSDTLTPAEVEAQKYAKREAEAREQAKLPYQWHQTLAEVDVTLPVPAGTRGRDVEVVIRKQRLRVALRKPAADGEPLVEGELFAAVKPDDCTWSVEDRCTLRVHLEKQNDMQWWPHVVTHHPPIDVTLIEPEKSKLSDLDGETRGMVEKMLFDQRQKGQSQDQPASDATRKREALEAFKRQHPEMDFSQAKVDM
ncbi:hypothetical protein IWQ60_012215 [Tieghemiomyces parasiticus]|uniref:Nuclear movement protein nudC n=1 Tax=Tieghemiomyces parasiticus TaxID=78921 RepID=A0A9W8DKY6_9FUNG|nr:hypothetical protein IWQ60_012215 [Tieghemiomyces parasiticus]